MTWHDWVEAIGIFAKHDLDGLNGIAQMEARHDLVWFPAKPNVNHEDAARLIELGWLWDEEQGTWMIFK